MSSISTQTAPPSPHPSNKSATQKPRPRRGHTPRQQPKPRPLREKKRRFPPPPLPRPRHPTGQHRDPNPRAAGNPTETREQGGSSECTSQRQGNRCPTSAKATDSESHSPTRPPNRVQGRAAAAVDLKRQRGLGLDRSSLAPISRPPRREDPLFLGTLPSRLAADTTTTADGKEVLPHYHLRLGLSISP